MTSRAQANLVGFAVAVVVVTAVTVAGTALANDALHDADRQPVRAYAAERLAAHLVAADAAHTRDRNVLRGASVANLTAADLDDAVPSIRGRPVRVRLGAAVVVERVSGSRGDRAGSALSVSDRRVRIERRVRVERTHLRTVRVALGESSRVSLADPAGRVAVRIDPGRGRRVTTVRAGGRVVLYDRSGLAGRYAFAAPPTRPLVVAFESRGTVAPRAGNAGTATVAWNATTATVERLVVVVGA
ncbi:MAG: hypothetical protein ABEK02_05245 [Haloquadratum sp.]